MIGVRYFDAHNHLQDPRLDRWRDTIVEELETLPILGAVVNGTHEGDWPAVAALARRHRWVIPSFGYHPWYLDRATPSWKETLTRYLDEFPFAIGEIGLDRWMQDPDIALQESMFLEQLVIAQERALPVSIHCLRAWGRLHELLRAAQPTSGFLLHSYGGPVELIDSLSKLGGYFSCPGYFLSPRKEQRLATFRHVPADRLLIETDAPDQPLPSELDRFGLSADGARLNHPGSIATIYEGVAAALNLEIRDLSDQIARNFETLFRIR